MLRRRDLIRAKLQATAIVIAALITFWCRYQTVTDTKVNVAPVANRAPDQTDYPKSIPPNVTIAIATPVIAT